MKLISKILIISILTQCSLMPWAQAKTINQVETIDDNIKVTVHSYKKTPDFVAVEVGFTNQRDKYVSFTPTEIYLNDEKSYSVGLLPIEEMHHIDFSRTHYSLIPLTVAIGLGAGAIGAGGGNVSRGLGAAALGVGGAFIVSEVLESAAADHRLVTFENNSLTSIDKLPPFVTLGGYLYFPRVKKPTSLTIVTQPKPGVFERKIIPLKRK